MTANTQSTKTRCLRQILGMLDRELGTSTQDSVPIPRAEQARLRLATAVEVSKMLRASPGYLQIAIHLMRTLGPRWSEALRASPAMLDRQRHLLKIKTKGGFTQAFHVPAELLARIAAIGEPEDTRTYIEILNGKPLTHSAIRKAWLRAMRKSKTPADLHPHDLRRAAAVELYEKTHDILAVKKFLGHQKIETTAWYLRAYEPPKEK